VVKPRWFEHWIEIPTFNTRRCSHDEASRGIKAKLSFCPFNSSDNIVIIPEYILYIAIL